MIRRALVFLLVVLTAQCAASAAEPRGTPTSKPFAIEVIDEENGWPVPLVELRTTHQESFFTDNRGVAAFDLPELMGRQTWLSVAADGYEAPADGFGRRGVRAMPEPGGKMVIKVHRTSIAKRLGRVTGAGLFGESQKLGRDKNWLETGVLGCDSVQTAAYKGKLFWAWGDTTLAPYPLGIFHTGGATSALRPLSNFEPPLKLQLRQFTDETGHPRGIAKMPGEGPTWISGLVVLPDRNGDEHLVATYAKINPPLEAYEHGLCAWNDVAQQFEHVSTVWTKSPQAPKAPPLPRGHAVFVEGKDNRWVLFGDPLPTLRCPASFEAWKNPNEWQALAPQQSLASADGGSEVKPHSGSIAWSPVRQRWVTIFMQAFGQPSAFGELWYAEADKPEGPWGPAVKVLSHRNYTFYNPKIHASLTPRNSQILLFEGTYTREFANRPTPTPRYDYNQILYRIDLNDPQLAPAHKRPAP